MRRRPLLHLLATHLAVLIPANPDSHTGKVA